MGGGVCLADGDFLCFCGDFPGFDLGFRVLGLLGSPCDGGVGVEVANGVWGEFGFGG